MLNPSYQQMIFVEQVHNKENALALNQYRVNIVIKGIHSIEK